METREFHSESLRTVAILPQSSPIKARVFQDRKAIVQETTNTDPTRGPALTRADVARLAAAAVAQVPNLAGSDETKETIARALAEAGQARTWNLLIDVVAQTGKYKPNSSDLNGNNLVVEGEKRYWLHIALGRDLNANGTVNVLGSQLEEVIE